MAAKILSLGQTHLAKNDYRSSGRSYHVLQCGLQTQRQHRDVCFHGKECGMGALEDASARKSNPNSADVAYSPVQSTYPR